MKTQLLVPAAGAGLRLGATGPKALVDVAGAPLLVRTLQRFVPLKLHVRAVIVISPHAQPDFDRVLRDSLPDTEHKLVHGGSVRQESVANGLDALDRDTDIVVIHDAARPFVSQKSIEDAIAAAVECGAATVAIPSTDTILVSDDDGFLADTPDRTALWACQTPQTFRVSVIRKAHQQARLEGFMATDDATLVRRMGDPVKLVPGTPLNFKVTTQTDLALAAAVAKGGLA